MTADVEGYERRIRVVHVITTLDVGGAQATMAEIVSRLDPSEFEPIVVAGTDPAPDEIADRLAAAKVPLLRTSSLRRSVSPRDPFAVRRLQRAFSILRPDVIHTHSSKAGVLGRLAADRDDAAKVIHTVHGWSFHDRQPAPAREGIIRLERVLARRTDALVVVTNRDRAIGLDHRIGIPSQYRLIRSGVDFSNASPALARRSETRSSLGLRPDQHVVSWVGRFAAQKNPSLLLEVVKRTVLEHSDAAFLLVGAGPLEADFRRHLEGVAPDRVHLLGLRDDVLDLLSASDVALLTSAWEGLPRVVVEAAALGLPVVSTDVGGIRDAVPPGSAWLVATDDLNGLLTGLALARSGGLRGPSTSEQHEIRYEFSADVMTRQTEELYRSDRTQ